MNFEVPSAPTRQTVIRKKPKIEQKLYSRRWSILGIYVIYNIISLVQNNEYSVIADVVVKYYNVSYIAVNWCTLIFSAAAIVLSIPGSYILDRWGLRFTLLTGIIGMCVGAWIKVASVEPSRFWVLMLGQGIVATFQVLILPVAPKLAAVWFGPKEVSFASGAGIVGLQLGIAMGLLIPPLIVHQGGFNSIQKGLHILAYGTATCTTLMTFITYFYFLDAPILPPSQAQLNIRVNKKSFDYKAALLKLCKNRSFVLMIFVHGVNIGTMQTTVVMLNQIILLVYPSASKDVGILGLLTMCCGIIGTTIYGSLISKFGKLKLISLTVYISAAIFLTLFLFLFDQGITFAYLLIILASVFLNGTFYIGFELVVELTYPEPLGSAGGLITISYQAFTIILTYMYTYFFDNFSIFWANLSLVACLVLADLLLVFVKFNFKRQAFEEMKKESNVI